ncbi:hypothetical protein F5Y09DRAFT_354186 [Xylaria sp. FL1042]|nr:hypothetical protein F5Y09DRAFT_354186 [Xylaria sp. FL1042]
MTQVPKLSLKGFWSWRLRQSHPAKRLKGYFQQFPEDDDALASDREGSEDEPLTREKMAMPTDCRCRKPLRHSIWAVVVFHLGLISVYTTVFFAVMVPYKYSRDLRSEIVHSPANDAIQLEPVIYNATLCIPGPFSGPPSPEGDQAWSDLVKYSHVRVSGEDLRRVNKTSIPLPGEKDTYWGILGVIHELHCLKRIRQYMYKDYYFPNLTAEQERLNLLHNDHCIEILRQATMCRGDVSIITMFWQDDNPIPVTDFSVPHACVNWDALYVWAKERSFDPMKPGYLQHPTLGASFADGHNHGIGVAEHVHHDPDATAGKEEWSNMMTGMPGTDVPPGCHV